MDTVVYGKVSWQSYHALLERAQCTVMCTAYVNVRRTGPGALPSSGAAGRRHASWIGEVVRTVAACCSLRLVGWGWLALTGWLWPAGCGLLAGCGWMATAATALIGQSWTIAMIRHFLEGQLIKGPALSIRTVPNQRCNIIQRRTNVYERQRSLPAAAVPAHTRPQLCHGRVRVSNATPKGSTAVVHTSTHKHT